MKYEKYMVSIKEIAKQRDALIKKIEKDRNHKDNQNEYMQDCFDWIIEEIYEAFDTEGIEDE